MLKRIQMCKIISAIPSINISNTSEEERFTNGANKPDTSVSLADYQNIIYY